MATLYNQYIYKNGAWMKIGTSSDSVTYTLSYSALTGLLTLTGSDGSTSTVTIKSGSSDAITGITVNGTTVTVTDGVAAISVPTTLSAFTNDVGYITVNDAPKEVLVVNCQYDLYTEKFVIDSDYNTILSAYNNNQLIQFIVRAVGETISVKPSSPTEITAVIENSGYRYTYTIDSNNNITESIFHLPVSFFDNDVGYITSYTETDPVFRASAAAGITATDISNWNAKSGTDEKVAISTATFNTTYYPILGTSTAASARQYTTNFQIVNSPNSSGSGYTRVTIGNVAASNGARACIRFNTGQNQHYTDIYSASGMMANNTVFLPSDNGTLALTTDIPEQASINSTGLITYKNSGGSSLFTLQLPLYNGGVS